MKIDKLGYLSFAMLLAGLLACSDNGGGGGDDDGAGDDGTADDGTDDGTEDDGADGADDGTEADAGPGADGLGGACLSEPANVPNEGWMHVPETAGTVYQNEPPASGPHYNVWATYAVHGELARGHWVHNVEHGAIVLLHRPDASAEVVAALTAAFEAIPDDAECGHKRSLVAADVDLTTPVAVIAADWVMEGDCVDQEAILAFVEAHRGQGAEQECDDGTIE